MKNSIFWQKSNFSIFPFFPKMLISSNNAPIASILQKFFISWTCQAGRCIQIAIPMSKTLLTTRSRLRRIATDSRDKIWSPPRAIKGRKRPYAVASGNFLFKNHLFFVNFIEKNDEILKNLIFLKKVKFFNFFIFQKC